MCVNVCWMFLFFFLSLLVCLSCEAEERKPAEKDSACPFFKRMTVFFFFVDFSNWHCYWQKLSSIVMIELPMTRVLLQIGFLSLSRMNHKSAFFFFLFSFFLLLVVLFYAKKKKRVRAKASCVLFFHFFFGLLINGN